MQKKRVLVVDDNAAIREIFVSILKSKGMEVTEAESCSQALDCVGNERFDAVLLDNCLSDGFGVDLIPDMKKYCPRIIMVTADEYQIRETAISLGAEAIFSKPFNVNSIIRHFQQGWKDVEVMD